MTGFMGFCLNVKVKIQVKVTSKDQIKNVQINSCYTLFYLLFFLVHTVIIIVRLKSFVTKTFYIIQRESFRLIMLFFNQIEIRCSKSNYTVLLESIFYKIYSEQLLFMLF